MNEQHSCLITSHQEHSESMSGFLHKLGGKTYEVFEYSMTEELKKIYSGINTYTIVPGVVLSTAKDVRVPKGDKLRFRFNKSLLSFYVALNGGGKVCYEKPLPIKHDIPDRTICVSYTPNSEGYTYTDKEIHSQVCLIIDPKILPDLLGEGVIAELPEKLNDVINGKSCFYTDWYKAPSNVLSLAEKILNPPFEDPVNNIFRCSAGLELLCSIIGSLKQSQKVSDDIYITEDDIKKFHSVKQILEKEHISPPSFTELCRMVGMNSFKMKRGFKRIFGTTVFGYLQEYRMSTAYRMLKESNMSVSECAWDLGYTNVSYFISTFRKYYGKTPGEFIKKEQPAPEY